MLSTRKRFLEGGNASKLLIPYNYESNHWRLMFINFAACTVSLVDSAEFSKTKAMTEFALIKKSFLLHWFTADFKDEFGQGKVQPLQKQTQAQWVQERADKFKGLLYPIVPQQPKGNEIDCGVCVCINMEILSRTGNFRKLAIGAKQAELDTARKLIRDALISGTISGNLVFEVGFE